MRGASKPIVRSRGAQDEASLRPRGPAPLSAPIRILAVGNLYSPHDFGGGYELVWRSAMQALVSHGHEVRILCSDHRVATAGPELDTDVHRELRWYWTPEGFPPRPFAECLEIERANLACLEAHVEEFCPDVVSWWSMGGMSMGLLERARRRGLPGVAFVHDDWMDYGRRTDLWNRRWRRVPRPLRALADRRFGVPCGVDLGPCARYVFVSRFTEARARRSGVALRDVATAHSGIEDSLLEGATAPPAWSWRLGSIGRIDPRKDVATAVRALAALPAEATLTVAGDGIAADVEELRQLVDELDLSERVFFLGRVDRTGICDFYDALDALLFPVAWEEPWGLVPLEAMARLRPVVATGTGGSGEYLREGENCLLFDPRDPAGLAAALRRLGADRKLRDRLVDQGVVTARRHTESAFNAIVRREIEAAGGQSSGQRDRTPP